MILTSQSLNSVKVVGITLAQSDSDWLGEVLSVVSDSSSLSGAHRGRHRGEAQDGRLRSGQAGKSNCACGDGAEEMHYCGGVCVCDAQACVLILLIGLR